MKRHDMKARRGRQFKKPGETAAHLVCGFLSKRYGENASGLDALPNEMNETTGQGACLTGTWACQGQLNCSLSPGRG